MASKIKTCRMQDIIHRNESGELDQERVLEIVGEVAASAADHPGHNVLMDLRKTHISDTSMGEILETAVRADGFEALHEIKIASVVPDEAFRCFVAERLRGCLQLNEIDYEVFTDLEQAREWLSN